MVNEKDLKKNNKILFLLLQFVTWKNSPWLKPVSLSSTSIKVSVY